MEDFWAPIVKDNDVFFSETVSPEMSTYVYEPSSSRPPSQFSVDNYYLCIDGDDGYNSGTTAAYIYESSSSTSPPSHISENGYLNNEEDYAAFANDYQPLPNSVHFENDLMPPIPPSRTRSKMHDLAVRHKLITDQSTRTHGGVLHLSAEEKRTLVQEGYDPPTSLPLSREQEEALKIVRRKIKNKLSAQESRRKRKEYIDSLEKKVHTYYNEALSLRGRLKQAELEKRDLINQLKRFQNSDIKDPSMLL